MPGKTTAGFTKSAQKQKFIRNRDIQLKNVEVKKEQRIQQGMVEGVCTKCRLKAQWRFRYDKYKPLKAPANCGNCRKKVVVKAYRAFCDPCAQQKHVCPGCGGKLDDPSTGAEDVVLDENEMMLEDEPMDNTSKISKMARTEAASSASSTAISSMETDVDEAPVSSDDVQMAASEATAASADVGLRGGDWDARKYHTIAATKYSKNRVVGATNDTVFAWGDAQAPSDDASGPMAPAAAEPSNLA